MIIQLLAALVGSLGFAALFNLHGKKLIVSALGGLGAWTVYLALNSVLTNANLSALITCALITLHSEFLARKMRAPAIIFMVVATIPLIPGAGLYRTAGALMTGNWQGVAENGLPTLLFAASMSAGIALVSLLFRIFARRH